MTGAGSGGPEDGAMAAGVEGREGSGRQIERRFIDYVPEAERHGKVWHQGPFWFLGTSNSLRSP